MFLKIHRAPEVGDIVAVCDRELLNITLHHGSTEVRIHESFYGSRPATADEVRDALEKAGNINLMGERSVSIAEDMGLITRADCIMIGEVPHVQIFRI
jgi:hypothetical protein